VIAAHHEEVTRRFAVKGADRFSGVDYQHRPTGPALTDAVAWIECELHDEHDAGDHTIVVARVVAIAAGSGVEPLVFFAGSYGSFRVAGAS
jgi:3-hydroxy-9,10-secoandrosta-1,3,5(10)-triene-9,17-dione monooxygenase reductase component